LRQSGYGAYCSAPRGVQTPLIVHFSGDVEAASTKFKRSNRTEFRSAVEGVKRGYSAETWCGCAGACASTHAPRACGELWKRTQEMPFVNSLGALTGNQAVQQVKAGVPAIYLSGWQVAADANDSLQMYPDQSLYAVSSVPTVVRRINNALARADQIQWMEAAGGKATAAEIDYFAPIVADAESGFGGVLNAYELMRSMIEAGAAGVHYEDQLASVKKCGHMGGKVLLPTQEAVQKLIAARLAATCWACRRCCSRAPTPRPPTSSPTTSTRTTSRSSPASVHRRASTRRARASIRRSRADWRTPNTPTWSGARPALPI
jgi:isocitrate lyase